MRTEIVYEDGEVLVVYKPAGLAVQTANVGRQDVVSELKNYITQAKAGGLRDNASRSEAGGLGDNASRSEAGGLGDNASRSEAGGLGDNASRSEAKGRRQAAPYLGVIHRLDQPVEGLLVFAKNPKAAARLSAQLREGEVGFSKHYYAALHGRPAEDKGRLEDYICKKGSRAEIVEYRPGKAEAPAHAPHGEVNQGRAGARKALLEYRILQMLDMQGAALADIRLETGRFHQIRAQMAHGGTPLLGDLKYGNEESMEAGRRLNVRNVALCAYRLEFLHPVTGRKMDFQVKPRGAVFSLFSQF